MDAVAMSGEAMTPTTTAEATQTRPMLVDDAALHRLSAGVRGSLHDELAPWRDRLDEVAREQATLLAALHTQAEQLAPSAQLERVAETLSRLPAYTAKLRELRRDMAALTTRVARMRQRADRLEQLVSANTSAPAGP